MIIANIHDPITCFNCKLENYVVDCPCNIGISNASDYRKSRHDKCPLIILPDNATNGDMIKALFNISLDDFKHTWGGGTITDDWWNALYKKEKLNHEKI